MMNEKEMNFLVMPIAMLSLAFAVAPDPLEVLDATASGKAQLVFLGIFLILLTWVINRDFTLRS